MANDKKRKERSFSGLSSMQEVTYAKEFKRADRAAKTPSAKTLNLFSQQKDASTSNKRLMYWHL